MKTLEIFQYQAKNCSTYKKYLQLLNIKISKIKKIEQIPFLPIRFFKNYKIISNKQAKVLKIFESSGTTGQMTSKHYITDLELYKQNSLKIFQKHYGNISEYCILALLPSYLERNNSSLVYMVDNFIEKTENEHSGFYLNNLDELAEKLKLLEKQKQKTLLIGVSFALLDFAEKYAQKLKNTIIMETGGMKGKREEISRVELHKTLQKAFGTKQIHSEYGMTELISQFYSQKQGQFYINKFARVLIRDIYNPFQYQPASNLGAINIIDKANINTCSFIETEDIGRINKNNSFEIVGRIDNSDIRGCNLMM